MNQTTRRIFGVAGFALLLATSASFAQQPAPVRVRGTVEAVDGPMLTVKSRDGQTTYKVKLTDNAAVRGIVKAPLTDIKDNSFIGVTGMPQSDGSQKAVEIHIFPEPTPLAGTRSPRPSSKPSVQRSRTGRGPNTPNQTAGAPIGGPTVGVPDRDASLIDRDKVPSNTEVLTSADFSHD